MLYGTQVEMDAESAYWVGFSVFPGIGPVRFRGLLAYFGSAKDAWNAPPSEFRKIKLGDRLNAEFIDFRKTFNIDNYLARLEKLHVSVLTLTNSKYPKHLKEIPDAPFVLYVTGKNTGTPINLERTIAVVGTRRITQYGQEVTKRLVGDLVAYGFTIVSGLAYGVDAVAHQETIDAGGKTIAVLGCGIDIIAPSSNARLYRDIIEGHGAVVSEMPLGHRPLKGLFPARNRIISGLSLGVLVTEGADDSGALITARNAGEQGRDVFAVPGPITSTYSRGPARLIKNGAKLVESVDDIIDELGLEPVRKTNHNRGITAYTGQNNDERTILHVIADKSMSIDDMVRATGLTISTVSATLSILEMKGVVKDYGEKEYGFNHR